jgi:hypothetical protein
MSRRRFEFVTSGDWVTTRIAIFEEVALEPEAVQVLRIMLLHIATRTRESPTGPLICATLVVICRCAIRVVAIDICGVVTQQFAFGAFVGRAPSFLIGTSFQVICDGACGVLAIDVRCRVFQNPTWCFAELQVFARCYVIATELLVFIAALKTIAFKMVAPPMLGDIATWAVVRGAFLRISTT